MPALPRDRGAFRRGRPGRAPSRGCLERRARWPTGAAAARVHRCSKTPTRPLKLRSRGALLAACASTTSADRCFNEHYLGPPEHPGPAESAGRDGCLCRSIVSFRSRQPPKVRRARGRGSPSLDAPSRDCSRERLRPDPDRFRHLVSRSLSVTPARSRRGGRTKPPASRALARHTRREGREMPRFREETGHSPTRGAFHRRAVRERGCPLEPASRFRGMPAPFSPPGGRARGRSRGARWLGLSIRETASCLVID